MLYECPYTLNHQTKGAAAWDIAAYGNHVIPAKGSAIVSTALKLSIPPQLYGMVTLRSGHGFKKDLSCHIGIIDSDYRGEVKVKVFNHGDNMVRIDDGERFAQLTLHMRYATFALKVDKIDPDTERGENGFGSTGEKV